MHSHFVKKSSPYGAFHLHDFIWSQKNRRSGSTSLGNIRGNAFFNCSSESFSAYPLYDTPIFVMLFPFGRICGCLGDSICAAAELKKIVHEESCNSKQNGQLEKTLEYCVERYGTNFSI